MLNTIDYSSLVLQNIKLNNELRPLQFQILEKLKNNNYVFVFDEVGCGKTIESGIVIWKLIKEGAKNILIVAPNNLVYNWYVELLCKFGINFKILNGSKKYIDIYMNNPTEIYKNNISKVCNYCITSNISKSQDNSNAGLDRISSYDITWDLIVIDEGHEEKNSFSERTKTLLKFKAKNVLFLSATPIKNIQEDFSSEKMLVQTILNNTEENKFDIQNKISEILNKEKIEFPEAILNFNLNFPFTRSFKETINNLDDFKIRNIKTLEYEIDKNLVSNIKKNYKGSEFDRKRGCIWLFNKVMNITINNINFQDAFNRYRKSKYLDDDVQILTSIDNKLKVFINEINYIIDKNERVIVFCNHIEVVEFLKKIMISKFGADMVEAIHGDTYSKEERNHRLFLLDSDDTAMEGKRIVILSHNIGSQGINFSKFKYLFNYELPYTPGDLEQRFGRIDRITNNSLELNMYIFEDRNNFFDTVYINRIVRKINGEVLPFIPSKNIISCFKNIENTMWMQIEEMIGLYKEIIGKNIEEICEICDAKKIILKYLEIRIHNKNKDGQILITSLDNKTPKGINDIIIGMETWIKNFLIKIGINTFIKGNVSSIPEKNLIIEKINQFIKISKNKVIFQSNIPELHLVAYSYEDISNKLYNTEYAAFENKIKHIQAKLEKDISELKCYYKENGLEKLINNISNYIFKLQGEVQFSALYGVWKSLNDKNLKLVELVNKYNKEVN